MPDYQCSYAVLYSLGTRLVPDRTSETSQFVTTPRDWFLYDLKSYGLPILFLALLGFQDTCSEE